MGLARTLPAEEITASRPVDPGRGEGVDVVFVITDVTPDKVPDPTYTARVSSYVLTVLQQPDNFYPVTGLTEMYETLKYRTQHNAPPIRRLRIVGHGSHDRARQPHGTTGGRTLMRDPRTGERGWIPPEVIEEYARSPEVREVMGKALLPHAVVEFWGCSLGSYEAAGTAWANLFGRTFVAPLGSFRYGNLSIAVRVGKHGEPGIKLRKGDAVVDHPPGGPWIYRHVKESAQADAWGPLAVKDFHFILHVEYERLRRAGVLPDFSTADGGAIAAMRRLFDAQGGQVLSVGAQRPGAPRRDQPILPDDPEWPKLWRAFPAKEGAVRPPAVEEGAVAPEPAPARAPGPAGAASLPSPVSPVPAPPTPAPPTPAPPTPAPPTPAPPTPAPAVPVPLPPPAITPQAPPQAARVAPAPPAPLQPAPLPRAPTPVAVSPARRLTPPSHAASGETQWERRRPEGRITRTGKDEWLLWNFGVGSARVKPEHATAFDEVRASLERAPGQLVVHGYASASGTVSGNERLALARAHAVAGMLQSFGARASSVIIRGLGERPPSPSPDASALDRSVTIRIPVRDMRRPLPAPEVGDGLEWRTSEPSRPGGAGRDVSPIGVVLEFKRSFKKAVPFGPDWHAIAEVEIAFKAEITREAPVQTVASLKGGKFDAQLKVALTNSIGLNSSWGDRKIGVQFRDVPLKPEVEVPLATWLSDPAKIARAMGEDPDKFFNLVSMKFTLPWAAKTEEYDLGILVPALSGVYVRGVIQPKVIVSLAPSKLLLSRLGVSFAARAGLLTPAVGVPVVAGIVGGVAWTILCLYLIDRSHKRGENRAHVVNLRRGYAYRLAAEAADWRPGEVRGSGSTKAWDEAREAIRGARHKTPPALLTETQKQTFRATYAALYEGWEAGGEALGMLSVADYDQLMQRLRQLAGPSLGGLDNIILRRLGGDSEKETPLDISWLGSTGTRR
jgi:outer membrane protein OmpA-like peptidoglycan-associated protein